MSISYYKIKFLHLKSIWIKTKPQNTYIMKKLLLYLLTTVVFAGCAATNDLTLRVTDPAPISLPNTVKRIGIVNRTHSNISKTLTQIDQLTTLELLTIDSTAALKTLDGFYDQIIKNPKFTNVVEFNSFVLDNSAINTFSPHLNQNQIMNICSDSNLDALFVLEFFDTDTKVDFAVVPVTKTVLGQQVNVVETRATVITGINLGWRIYGANGTDLYDEYAMHQQVVSTGSGVNPINAIRAVTGQKNQVENASYNLGTTYALQLLPVSYRVGRIYYVRGSNNFKIGKRLARAGQWDEAAKYWQKEVDNPKSRIAGRAYYNMAIINEINDDIDAAIDWAQKSYTLFNNRKALYYLNILKNRKASIDELKRQQQN